MVMDVGEPPYLPEEIIRNILTRLPVKPLFRFQCVCKRWRNLLKASSFIADHLHQTPKNSVLLFECYGECHPDSKCDPLHLYFVDRDIRLRNVQNAPSINPKTLAGIVGSSNGLLCVRFYGGTNHSLLLCNLAIGDVRMVPKSRNHVGEGFHVGFGFSPVVNDYRIVRLCERTGLNTGGVEVFSVSTDLWKKVEVGNLEGVTFMNSYGFLINGAIFWFGFGPKKGVVEEEGGNVIGLIVSFDIAMEVFTLIPMPPINNDIDTNFAVYENKLAVLYPNKNSEACWIELWVMEKDASEAGERERWSWTRKYSSNPYPFLLSPKTIWGNEIVCRVYAMHGTIKEAEGEVENVETKTLLINLTTHEFNTFPHRRLGPYHGIFNHVESLVKVNNVPDEEP